MGTKDSNLDTLVEEDGESTGGSLRGWLISIGSPEDNFAAAGGVTPLTAGSVVNFGRTDASDGMSIETEGNRTEVGIPFGWVSGEHATLEVERREAQGADPSLTFKLRDLGSRNGTLVNGQRLSAPRSLRSGDVFELGRSFWTVREVRLRRAAPERATDLDPTGTVSPHLHHIHRTLHRLAPSSIPILLRGETGTGKEYLARALHRVSGRPGPFVVANLGALSEARVENALFGDTKSPGLFEQATGGTLMLDELGELSPSVQSKLLSALTEGRAARVGEKDARSFDVRLIASTLHDLSASVDAGTFRPDLYSRLAGFVAELPPLRSRREDLGLLCRHFVGQLQKEGRPSRITSNAFRRILSRAWPFNVRQLNQALATAGLLASGDGTITADALAEILEQDDGLPQNPDEVRRVRAELVRSLTEHGGDIERVAEALGREPYQLGRWMERFALRAESYRPSKS